MDDDQGSPLEDADNSITSSIVQVQIQEVERDENILIDSRSQVSSFVMQANRIESLESENLNLETKLQKTQQQLRSANNEKQKLVNEKAELEARLRQEIVDKVRAMQEKCEVQARETVLQNAELKRDLEGVKQAKYNDKTNFQRQLNTQDKQITVM